MSTANLLEVQAFTQYIHAITSDVNMKCYFDLDHKATPYNNGKEIHLHTLSPKLTCDDLSRIRAYIVHEVGHKKYTDFNIISEKPELRSKAGEEQSLTKEVWAQLEDHRVDYLTVKKGDYLGDKHVLMQLEDMIGDTYLPQVIPVADKLDFNSTVKAAVYAMDVGHRDTFLPGSGISGNKVEDVLLDKAKRKKVIQKILKHKDSLDAIREIEDPRLGSEATYQLAKRLVKEAQEQEDEDKEKQEGDDDGQGEGKEGEEGEVAVSPTEFKPSHVEAGKPQTDMDLPAPTYDTDELPPISGLDQFIIVNYPKRSVYIGVNSGYYGTDWGDKDYSSPFAEPSQRVVDAVDSILANACTAQLQNEIRRILQVRSRATTAYNQKRGKLSSKDVYRVTMKDAKGFNERVFTTKRDALSLDVAVSVLCDFSGSMSGSRITNAIAATKMLTDTLKSLGINHEVAGFTTGDSCAIHLLFKEFGKTNRNILDDMLRGENLLCANSDADNVVFAASRLANQKAKRKVLIVLSDGSPAGFKNGNDTLLLKKVVTEDVPRNGIEVIGLGICTDYGKRIYPNWETLQSAGDLEAGLLNLLRRNIFNV